MIRLDRAQLQAPSSLPMQGSTELQTLEALAIADKLADNSFDSSLYSSKALRQLLWENQREKCCFCERKYERKRSTVEHFRPKTAVNRGQSKEKPGYWWLAYELNNLYFCCANCNGAKGIFFPLEQGSPRLQAKALPWQPVPNQAIERPLLLDPGFDDPAEHLTFVELPGGDWDIAPKDLSERGRETIARTELDRDDLKKLRKSYFSKHIKPVLEQFRAAETENNSLAIQHAQERARSLAESDAEYSLMAKVIFRHHGLIGPASTGS